MTEYGVMSSEHHVNDRRENIQTELVPPSYKIKQEIIQKTDTSDENKTNIYT